MPLSSWCYFLSLRRAGGEVPGVASGWVFLYVFLLFDQLRE